MNQALPPCNNSMQFRATLSGLSGKACNQRDCAVIRDSAKAIAEDSRGPCNEGALSESTAPAYGRRRAQGLLLLPRAGVLPRAGSFLFRS